MKTKAIELYHELRKIDPSPLWVKGIKEKKLPTVIAHQARFIGSEFDRSLKYIISKKNESNNKGVDLTFSVDQNTDEKIRFRLHSLRENHKRVSEKFDLKKYLDSYDFQSAFKYGIKNKNEIFHCQQYLQGLHKNINIDNISSNKLCVNGFNIRGYHILQDNPNGNGECAFLSGSPDLLLDDRLLDIKSDIKINGRKTKYVAQLLFYYFLIQAYTSSIQDKGFEKDFFLLDIQKIGIYYASYDKLIEVDIEKIIPNKNKLIELVKNEIVYGNYFIRKIIEKSLLVKPLSDIELKDLEDKIKERQTDLYQTWDRHMIKHHQKQFKFYDYGLDYYKERLSPSQYKAYKTRINNSIQETRVELEKAHAFVLEIDNEILRIKIDATKKHFLKNKPDKKRIDTITKQIESIEFRRLIIARRQLMEKIENFDQETQISQYLSDYKKRLKFINKEIKEKSI